MPIHDLQRKMARLLIAFGFSAAVVNFILLITLRGIAFGTALTVPGFYVSLAVTVLVAATYRINRTAIRIMHLIIILSVAAAAILDDHESFYGLGFSVAGFILAYKYGFLNRWARLKTVAATLLMMVLVEISVLVNGEKMAGTGLHVLIFMTFFIAFLFIAFRDDINKLSRDKKKLEENLAGLVAERNRLNSELEEKSLRIAEFERHIEKAMGTDAPGIEDLRNRYGLTAKETEIIVIVYTSGMGNREISEKLGISTGTIKQHLSRIYSKLEVDSRTRMLTVIRSYMKTAGS